MPPTNRDHSPHLEYNGLYIRRSPFSQPKERVYTDAEVIARVTELGLAGWYLEEGWLRRKFNTDGWPPTLMVVNAIGYLCEAACHHADLAVTWGKLWVKLKTHSAGGITDKDFAVAKKIEEVALWRPSRGTARDWRSAEVRIQQILTHWAHHEDRTLRSINDSGRRLRRSGRQTRLRLERRRGRAPTF